MWVAFAVMVAVVAISTVSRVVAAESAAFRTQHMVTIYDGGVEQTIITRAGTVAAALKQAGVTVNTVDLVEPALGEELVAEHYNINVYRARPIIVEDGATRLKTVTAAQSPVKIAEAAKVTLYPEDDTRMARVNDVVYEGGAGLKMIIDRATPLNFVLYGKQLPQTRTQATTVGQMLREKNVKLGPDDGTSVPLDTKVVAGMSIEVWRNGVQTITQEEDIPMPVEQIKDQDRDIGFKEVRSIGKVGKKQVTYQIEVRNGKEIGRKVIQEVQSLPPVKQVEVVGAKRKGGTPAENRVLGKSMMLEAGFGEDQWSCLDNLWTRESGWDQHKSNYGGSGAYGIPQALPGSKMGPGWEDDAVVQINWGLNYIKGRYSTPCGAWSAFQSKGWY